MKRLITTGFAFVAITTVAPANALTERFNDSFRDNLNKGIVAETNLSERHQESFNEGLYRLSDRQRQEFIDGLYRLTERFDIERNSTLNR